MNGLKRGIAMAAAAASVAAFAPAAASAAISPDPYSTTTGTGRVSLTTPLGTGSCNLGGIAANATGTATGAAGAITGYTASGCLGIVTAARFSSPMAFTVASGVVTLNFSILKTNIFGGQCLYAGTFRGTMTNGSNTFTVSGTKALLRTLAGICEASYATSLQVVLPNARISW